MMVNDRKNNFVPWQSTVPQQMPWMNNYDPTSLAMQFGANLQQHHIDPHLLMQQQLPSLISYPTATTSTQPITVCPTSSATSCLFTSSCASSGVTTTTQSCPMPQNLIPTFDGPNYCHYAQNTSVQPILPTNDQTNAGLVYNPGSSLTPMSAPPIIPSSLSESPVHPHLNQLHHKRSSIEMEDDLIRADEPPTKQLLSERKLFKQFGSLRLNGSVDIDSIEDEDSDGDRLDGDGQGYQQSIGANEGVEGREEFNRYVYLLFKDKKTRNENSFGALQYNSTLDRLAREERDKLSKAVVLWNPPLKNSFFNSNPNDADYEGDDDDDEEDCKYKDHRDFLKESAKGGDDDSIIITEIPCDSFSANNSASGDSCPDDIMFD